jgi:hypothetical protein
MPDWLSTITQICYPALTPENSQKLSDATSRYNCIAFAAGDTNRWWEPPVDHVLDPGQYWPEGAPTGIDLDSCVKAYQRHGFERISRETMGDDFQTIALYAHRGGEMSHAARLNKDGSWLSKLGDLEDISHDYLASLEGDSAFGSVRLMMSRLNP